MATETKAAHKPWKVEYAKSSRSSCRACGKPIAKDAFRLAKIQPAHQFDGLMPVSISKANQFPDDHFALAKMLLTSFRNVHMYLHILARRLSDF